MMQIETPKVISAPSTSVHYLHAETKQCLLIQQGGHIPHNGTRIQLLDNSFYIVGDAEMRFISIEEALGLCAVQICYIILHPHKSVLEAYAPPEVAEIERLERSAVTQPELVPVLKVPHCYAHDEIQGMVLMFGRPDTCAERIMLCLDAQDGRPQPLLFGPSKLIAITDSLFYFDTPSGPQTRTYAQAGDDTLLVIYYHLSTHYAAVPSEVRHAARYRLTQAVQAYITRFGEITAHTAATQPLEQDLYFDRKAGRPEGLWVDDRLVRGVSDRCVYLSTPDGHDDWRYGTVALALLGRIYQHLYLHYEVNPAASVGIGVDHTLETT